MRIALFPLHVVAFPGASIPLRIFELRYRAMMEQVLAHDRRFGVVAIRHGMEVGGYAETHDVGCLAEIDEVTRSEDGSMEILASGIQRFRIDERLPDDPFPIAEASPLADTASPRAPEALVHARAAVNRYLAVVARLHGVEVAAPPVPSDPVAASFALADVLQIDLPERQQLLEATDAETRLVLTTELARREAILLAAVGPSVGRPGAAPSLN